MEKLNTFLYDLLIEQGLSEFYASLANAGVFILLIVILVYFINLIGSRIFLKTIARLTAKTETKIDDILHENHVFYRITLLFPVIAIYAFDSIILAQISFAESFVFKATNIFAIGVIASIFRAVFVSFEQIFSKSPTFKDKPLTSYRQLLNIFNYCIAIILIVSIIIDKSPMYLLSALGAVTAIILLVFRDSILGFTASIQLASNDMVRVGDWVTLSAYGADGDVLEISLNTVKVQNFDKTITTVPTYAFISSSFTNWRGMEDSDGRRIRRAIHIKIDSIKFCDKDLFKRLKGVTLIQDYIEERTAIIDQYNQEKKFDTSIPINGRRQTNIGLFRIYLEEYLKDNPNINEKMTLMVRQLPPTQHGLPIEIYCFSKDKRWVNYEGIIADLFDHILAAAPYFDLEIFQNPSGNDFKSISKT
ncbi:MAG: mechanosensitive ion channel family protein [Salibacteraceae bacterium]